MASLVWSALGPYSVSGTGAAADTLDTTASNSAGMNLASVGGFAVYAEADSGQTISTAVNAKAYVQDPYSGRWARAEAYDITGQTVTGVRSALIGSFLGDNNIPLARPGHTAAHEAPFPARPMTQCLGWT